MPRQRRQNEPGDILSIVTRAHQGEAVFRTDADRCFFVDQLARVFPPTDFDLLAWALLRNHYHLLIRVTNVAPAVPLQRLNAAIAQRERRRRGDRGAIFQGRYWAGRCEGDGAVMPVLTYVLGNPAHHRIVTSAEALESYVWTAYPAVLGRAPSSVVAVEKTLALLDPDANRAREMLRAAMASRVSRWHAQVDGVDRCEQPDCRGESDGCGLIHTASDRERAIRGDDERRGAVRGSRWRIEAIAVPICARVGVDPHRVLAGGRRHPESQARAVVAYVACEGLRVSGAAAAEALRVSGPSLSIARVRGRAVLAALGWTIDDVLAEANRIRQNQGNRWNQGTGPVS